MNSKEENFFKTFVWISSKNLASVEMSGRPNFRKTTAHKTVVLQEPNKQSFFLSGMSSSLSVAIVIFL
jgi:hypothetical protein